jgi:protein SCO1/2
MSPTPSPRDAEPSGAESTGAESSGAEPSAGSPSQRERSSLLAKIRLLAIIAVGLIGVLCLAFAWLASRAMGPGSSAEKFAYSASPEGSLPELWPVPAFSFKDQHGQPRSERDLLGHVWIADFIFTTCTTVCPLLSAKLVLLQHQLPDERLRFVSFSVDPEHDTPEVLTRYAEQWRKDPRWVLLSTDPAGIQATARDMRVALMKTDDAVNPIMHTSMFFLVDAVGQVRGVYDSADDQALERLAADVDTLNGGRGEARAFKGSGPELYQEVGCGACHADPKLAPALTGLAGRDVTLEGGANVRADADYLRDSLLRPGNQIRQGYLNLMPSYAGRLSDAQIEQLVSYVQTLPEQKAPDQTAPDQTASDQTSPKSAARPLAASPAASGAAPVARSSAPASASGATPVAPSSAPASVTGAVALAAPPVPSTTVDPVCEMRVRVTPDAPHVAHAGHDYYFCSSSCRDRFAAQPSKYLP